MLIIPAIDLRQGRCVRLTQGRAEAETVYSEDPVKMAQHWAALGAPRLHLVDLDGAFEGLPKNWEVVQQIRKKVSIPIELGGGIRRLETAAQLLESGIDYLILGSVLVTDPVLAQEAVGRYGDKIIAGVDCQGQNISIKGWKETSPLSVSELGKKLLSWGVRQMIYTDISRDGMLSGPNLPAIRSVAQNTGLQVIASGGISNLDDISALCGLESEGVNGMIIGKALYTGAIDLKKALEVSRPC